MINRICSPTSRQYDWKIQSVLFSVFFFVVCLVLLVVRQTNIVHSFRVSSSFHVQFPLDITMLICPQNVDLSAQWILNWFHDVPFSENEIKYPIHEELYQHTVSSILVCSIQIVDQIMLFESYFLLERLDQLFILRNYVNLYFQREYLLILNGTQTKHLSLDVIFCYSDISLSFSTPVRRWEQDISTLSLWVLIVQVLCIVWYVFFRHTDWVNTACVWMCIKYELCRMTLTKNRVHQGSDS